MDRRKQDRVHLSVENLAKKQVHMIGIGGCGMSGIAAYLNEKGVRVTGSDQQKSGRSDSLKEKGMVLQIGHEPDLCKTADYIVISSAIKSDNPELKYADKHDIPVLKRAEMLAIIFNSFFCSIAVAGTHGKTTCSGLLAHLFAEAKVNPSFIVGSDVKNRNSNYHMSQGEVCIIEADESDGTFVFFEPTLGIISNIEEEHMSFFGTKENLLDHFLTFTTNIHKKEGLVLMNQDDPLSRWIIERTPCAVKTFSLEGPADYEARDCEYSKEGVAFTVWENQEKRGRISIPLLGKHNIYNTLSCVGLCLAYGLPFDAAKKACETFMGTARRLQKMGEHGGISVYDDYGHHPTEIQTTLNGIKRASLDHLVCIFQPHRYSRTKEAIEAFKTAFKDADHVIILDIYAASEKPIPGITSEWLVNQIKEAGHPHVYYRSREAAIQDVVNHKSQWHTVVTMGAGDISKLPNDIVAALSACLTR